jgi:NitT/TauT family transport system permease protein
MTSNNLLRDKILPIGTVVLAIIAIWYAAAVFLNTPFERDQAQRAGTTISFSEILPRTMAQERPVLPAPHQVFAELWDTTVGKKITSKRSLVFHSGSRCPPRCSAS